MLKHIAEFFALEKDIRGRSAEERRLIRQQRGRPLADAFQKWLRTKRGLISQKGKLADAIRRLRRRRRALRRHRFGDRNLQAERRRSARLSCYVDGHDVELWKAHAR